jgi:ribosome-associated heat shock protein Hsp15
LHPKSESKGGDDTSGSGVRLDVWLDVACLFKTRSEAQQACKSGRVDVNREAAKPHRRIKVGDEIEISRPLGRKQRIRITGIAERHMPKADARKLYEDLTPAPTPEEIEARRLARIFRASIMTPNSPDKRQRRALRKLRGKD